MTTKKLSADSDKVMEEILGGPLTFGDMICALRHQYESTQAEFAKKLKIKKAYLCDLEKGRRLVSPFQAAKFANILKHPESFFVKLALEDILRRDKLKFKVEVRAA